MSRLYEHDHYGDGRITDSEVRERYMIRKVGTERDERSYTYKTDMALLCTPSIQNDRRISDKVAY